MQYYKPVDIARALHISTSALRHYESWGVVPAPDRDMNGYRLYTDVHLAYFRCLRAMFPGFGVGLTCTVLKHIQHEEVDEAFWLVNEEQANLHQEKVVANQLLTVLEQIDLPTIGNKTFKSPMTIGEAAEYTGVAASAIRHWEKEGLIIPERNPENGYRMFNALHIRKILLLRTLRSTLYFLKSMKEIVEALDHHSIEQAKKVTENAIRSLHDRNRQQFRGVHELVKLCKVLQLM